MEEPEKLVPQTKTQETAYCETTNQTFKSWNGFTFKYKKRESFQHIFAVIILNIQIKSYKKTGCSVN